MRKNNWRNKGLRMTPKEVREYFGTGYKLNQKTGMSDNNLNNWDKLGYVPFKTQKKIEQLTNGELVAVWDDKEPYFSPNK